MEREKRINVSVFAILVALEIAGLMFLGLFSVNFVLAGIGQNVTTLTKLEIGNAAPEIVNITIYPLTNGGIDLMPNATKTIIVQTIVMDYNGESDINSVRMEFYDVGTSFYGAANDNNSHYTNTSCSLDLDYGDSMELNATCTFDVWYYANNATWNVTVYAIDNSSVWDIENQRTTVNTLLSLGLPDSIDYGVVNATNVSDEITANVTNFGNVRVNLSLEGYAVNEGDGWAMNCTLGSLKNISILYEKYNLTASNDSMLSLTDFESRYVNLTSNSVVKKFGLNYQHNEGMNEAVNATYWRIYVPKGVAGSCSGNIIFGATKATGN